MTKAIELAKECGIIYCLTPEGTTEMRGTDRQIEAFADVVLSTERERVSGETRRDFILTDEQILIISWRALDKCYGADAQHVYIAREVERIVRAGLTDQRPRGWMGDRGTAGPFGPHD